MFLFVASANVGYCIFTNANEKFTDVFVRAFTISDATWLNFGKPTYRLENCHATVSLIYAVCISAPNRFGLELYDVIIFNDVVSATDSLESVKDLYFNDV